MVWLSSAGTRSMLSAACFWDGVTVVAAGAGTITAAAARSKPTPSSGKAIASRIFGIVGILILPGIGSVVSVVLGHLAIDAIRSGSAKSESLSTAIAGLVLGYAGIALLVIVNLAIVLTAVAIGSYQAARHTPKVRGRRLQRHSQHANPDYSCYGLVYRQGVVAGLVRVPTQLTVLS